MLQAASLQPLQVGYCKDGFTIIGYCKAVSNGTSDAVSTAEVGVVCPSLISWGVYQFWVVPHYVRYLADLEHWIP